jgi:hypothetical protein
MSRKISRYGWLPDLPDPFGFTVYESFESAQVAKTSHASLPKSDKAAIIGDHAVMCGGYDDAGAGLEVADKVSAIDEVEFEGAPEAFHGGVVVAVAFAAHGRHQSVASRHRAGCC